MPPVPVQHHRRQASTSGQTAGLAHLAGPSQPRRNRPPPPYLYTQLDRMSCRPALASTASSSSLSSNSSFSSTSSLATTVSSCSLQSASRKRSSPLSSQSSSSSYSSSSMSSASSSSSRASSSGQGITKRRASPASTGASKLHAALKKTPKEVLAAEAKKAAAEAEKLAGRKMEYDALQASVAGLCEVLYMDEVREYMYEMESKTKAAAETIDMQPELQWYMRPYLLDFLIEIHQQYRLRPETLYLAINIIDRYVSKRIVFKKHYQLVGCASLWIAAKFEDAKDRVPTVQDLTQMCCSAYEESAFIQMEGHVLSTIGWVLGHPTAEAWLRLRCVGGAGAGGLEEQKTQHVARFLMEITLFHRAFVGLRASDTAAASLLLARFILGKTRRLADENSDVLRIVHLIDSHLADHLDSVSTIVVKKYSFSFYSRSATVVREWYLSGNRFSTLGWSTPSPVTTPLKSYPGKGCIPRSNSAGSGMGSDLSSPTSSCGMMRSPGSSSDGCGGSEFDGDTSRSEEDETDEDDDDCAMPLTPLSPEPPRYAIVDPYGHGVSVKENLRQRDTVAMLKQKEDRKEVLGQTWDSNVIPMSC